MAQHPIEGETPYERSPFSDEEVELIAKFFSGRYAARNKALFTLGVRSGFRISEMLSLTVGAVFQHGKVWNT
jgi:integrase